MSKLFLSIVPLMVTATVLLALYVGSYAYLVKSVASPVDPFMKPRVARYRFGGVWAETFFFPAELVDRKLRHEYWTTSDCLRDWVW
jgi:hypothetical protein